MDSIKFKIDPKQERSFKRKGWNRIIKIGLPSVIFPIILVSATGGYSNIDNGIHLLLLILITLVMIGLPIWIGARMAIKNSLSVQLELNNEGIQRLMQNSPFVTIPWESIDLSYNKNGELILVNKKVNPFLRWLKGYGKIHVPNELGNYDKFLEIIKRMKKERATTKAQPQA